MYFSHKQTLASKLNIMLVIKRETPDLWLQSSEQNCRSSLSTNQKKKAS